MIKIRCLKTIKNQLNFLRLSSNAATKKTVKYTDTINLPKSDFPARLSAAKRTDVERKINEVTFDTFDYYKTELLKKL